MQRGNLNIKTEKSEQTVFAQISLSQYEDFFDHMRCEAFQEIQHNASCRTLVL